MPLQINAIIGDVPGKTSPPAFFKGVMFMNAKVQRVLCCLLALVLTVSLFSAIPAAAAEPATIASESRSGAVQVQQPANAQLIAATSYQLVPGVTETQVILNQKEKDAQNQKTDMQIDTEVFSTLPFTDREIISLFGNLLDNALEACEKINDKERWIKIKIKKKNRLNKHIV